jgi:hypothetical protein
MMFIILAIIVLLDLLYYNRHFKRGVFKKMRANNLLLIAAVIHSVVSLFICLKILFYKGSFEENSHITSFLDFMFLISAGMLPKIILSLTSIPTDVKSRRFPSYFNYRAISGKVLAIASSLLVVTGTLYGRFNFKVEEIGVKIENLPESMVGLKIVQISDLHLSSFHRHSRKLEKAINIIRDLEPDILVNTGDYVSFGYREMEPFIDILSKAGGKYGSFAILGNHDIGTYHPDWNQELRDTNVVIMSRFIDRTGYDLLIDENRTIRIGSSTLSVIGVSTSGSIPDIFYGDINRATIGSDTTNFRLLLSHDPNHWVYNKADLEGIELTLSGHTHGMQLGLLLGSIRISPARLIFPAWYGLYGSDNQYLYVNRGLGVIGFPFRIGMPPEITLLVLE